MIIYDDKTKGIIESGGRFILPVFKPCDEAIFKASYVVISSIKCEGKIAALFDLIVLGDIEADIIEIKGKFICLGNCEVHDLLIVQNEIWANDIRATHIEAHDEIVVQSIDGDTIIADGNIVAGKVLAVERLAKSKKNILCGETAYGAGKVAANIVITGEPIDLDEGEEAIVAPNLYIPELMTYSLQIENMTVISCIPDFASMGNWMSYLDWLIDKSAFESEKQQFKDWKETLSKANELVGDGIDNYRDLNLLIQIIQIAFSDYFKNWSQIQYLYTIFNKHFMALAQSDKTSIVCSVGGYGELLQALDVLNQYGSLMDKTVYESAFETLMSNFGLKSKFVTERLNEKGWRPYG